MRPTTVFCDFFLLVALLELDLCPPPPPFVAAATYENKLLHILEYIYIIFIYNTDLFLNILFTYNTLSADPSGRAV
jgi:hypothetical protein